MEDYKELEIPIEITMAVLQKIYDTGTGNLRVILTDNNERKCPVQLSALTVHGLGNRVFSAAAAQYKGVSRIIPDNPRLEICGSVAPPLRRHGYMTSWNWSCK